MADRKFGFKAATDAIIKHGCPICGEEPNFYFIDGPQGISLSPCGHTMTPADARDMAELERKKMLCDRD